MPLLGEFGVVRGRPDAGWPEGGQTGLALEGRGRHVRSMSTPIVAQKAPYPVNVEAGKTYAWCACGGSKNQPFCDGSHKGTGLAPKMYKAETAGTVYFCGCKNSKAGAACDGTHKTL